MYNNRQLIKIKTNFFLMNSSLRKNCEVQHFFSKFTMCRLKHYLTGITTTLGMTIDHSVDGNSHDLQGDLTSTSQCIG